MAVLQSSSKERSILKHFFCYCGVAEVKRGDRRPACTGVNFSSLEQPWPAYGQQAAPAKLCPRPYPLSIPTSTSLIRGGQEECPGLPRLTPRSIKLRCPSDT